MEILKALYRNAKLLVLDEPTAVLTPQEVEDFFETLRKLADNGRGLIFISHKLPEVLTLSDRITVLRDGKVSGITAPSHTSREELAEMMVGRQVNLSPNKVAFQPGNVQLQLKSLTVQGDKENIAVNNVSFDVRSSEIVGIAGVSGNGQRELAESIAGLRKVQKGKLFLGNKEITNHSPRDIRNSGLSYVPEERMRDGAIGEFSVKENCILIDHKNEDFSKFGFLKVTKVANHAEDITEKFNVKTPSIETSTKSLSGGNIQKLIMARELSSSPKVLLAAQPTRGVDIGAAEYIHQRLIEQRDRGTAIILISEDLDEILALSDRVVVMFEGEIVADLDSAECSVSELGLLMGGVKQSGIIIDSKRTQ